jgi:Subtilase family
MRRSRLTVGVASAAVVLGTASFTAMTSSPAVSAPNHKANNQVRSALGMGLGRLIASSKAGTDSRAAGGVNLSTNKLTVRDAKGRILIDATPQAGADAAAFRKQAEALGMVVKNTDAKSGMIEGYAPLSAVTKISALKNAGTVAQSLKPHVFTGSVTSQGVHFQRIDKAMGKHSNGKGITIAALSDSYDTATTQIGGDPLTVHADDDVASGDLPNDVVVLQDGDGNDEGRAMLQILHDIAPKAKLCFATADFGILNFAHNIRALANKKGDCGADIIVDDVAYFEEGEFSDNPISDSINAVAKKGVSYFSSEGNEGGEQGWASKVRLLKPGVAKKHDGNLNWDGADRALYNGGVQDANTGHGTDVAQTISTPGAGGLIDLQWDDPYDRNGAKYSDPLYSANGSLDGPGEVDHYTWNAPAEEVGKQIDFRADGIPTGSTDVKMHITGPDGFDTGEIDAGVSPEFVDVTLPAAGAYHIDISGFEDAEGPYSVTVREIVAPSLVTSDFNILIFDVDGNYLGAIADANRLSGRPQEFSGLGGLDKFQIVITRSRTDTKAKATRLRLHAYDDLYFTEYGDPTVPATHGHAFARMANGVAAIDPFKPYLPEDFTSPGGKLKVYFNTNGKRYKHPQVRLTPKFAATDGGNTTFFVSDSSRDADTFPNFFGTSAAAPHAAGIAALVLQKHGGPGSVSPTKMTKILQQSTFRHDLNPFRASGSKKGLTIQARGAEGYERGSVPGEQVDKRFFKVSYHGKSKIKSIRFYGETASPTANGKNGHSAGLVFDPRPFNPADFVGSGFPFTIGGTHGVAASSVKASFSKPGGTVDGVFKHMLIKFKHGLHKGQWLKFGVDRDLALSPFGDTSDGNGADELGGAVLLPQRTVLNRGLKFVAVLANGHRIHGMMHNRLGHGWTPIDGFGVIDAQKAVFGK